MDSCLANEQCVAFTFDRENRFDFANCWLKSAAANFKDNNGHISGVRCDQELPTDQAEGEYPGEL